MSDNIISKELLEKLRDKAHQRIQAEQKEIETLQCEDMAQIVYELRVHQIELEMQNEELIRSQLELSETKERYFDLYDMAPIGYFTLSEDGLIIEANLSASNLLGVTRNILIKTPITHFIFQEDQDIYYLFRKKFFKDTDDLYSCELRMLKNDGTLFWVQITVSGLNDSNIIRLIMSDITERKESQEKLKLSASVFNNAGEGIAITDAQGIIVETNRAFTEITGYSRAEAFGKTFKLLSSGKQSKEFYEKLWNSLVKNHSWKGEIYNRRKNDEIYHQILSINGVVDSNGKIKHYIALFNDNSVAKNREEELDTLAHYDSLTSLPNRVLLIDRLNQAMIRSHRYKQSLVVVYLDLDGFKEVNDNYGHEIGDQLLISLGSKMQKALREGDTIARIGGDEFIAVLPELSELEDAIPLINRLLDVASQEVHIGELVVKVSASLGATIFPQQESVDADQLIRQADQAMYQAKLSGKNHYEFFDIEQNDTIKVRYEAIERLRKALSNDELILYYQPKVNMLKGEVIGMEALIRWQHPERGLVPPLDFLPVIENHPFSIDLGEWVISNALAQIEQWQLSGVELGVSVNISAYQLMNGNFAENLSLTLLQYPNVAPSLLEIEILETSRLEDVIETSEIIMHCKDFGVSFALDDFGTGYSSLTYLKQLPIKLIKIDQSFVKEMLHNKNDLAILEGIISLATAFGHDVIAEGVETIEHGELLLQMGCHLAQGYAISRPMPSEEVLKWISTWSNPITWKIEASDNKDC